ncbi:oligosaccharide flippase family protein [Desulfuromonas sp. AOP6]|uniref:lipopolysaccharide biosynthesis protein n=1 Tax=Desulfuromonas sp. AOP6 TaxID=1566351 RepID=UPI001271F3F4|nr:oligosaccharide flippase family protein [Desulfuromonas sp. AOP6]BCA79496.1 undecaprenyl-diphospho-oligosaccharide flippase [Desulfuromonas sp. AOP6]
MTAAVSHIQHTFRHAVVYSGASILSRIVGFLMLPVYSHYLRGEGYGIIGMIDVVLSMMTLVVGYGIAGAMGRFYFEQKTEQERKTLVSTTMALMLAMVLLVSSPVLIFHESVAWLALGSREYGYYLVIAALAFICEMSAKAPEAYILLRQKPFLISFLSLGRLVLGLSLNIYLIVSLEMGVLGYLYASLLTGIATTVVMHGYALYHVGFGFDRKVIHKILRFSLPLLPGYVAMFVRGNADRVILRTYLGLAQLGAFEMLFKFATLLGVLIVEPFSKIWNVKRYEICDAPEGPETMARMFSLQLALLLFFGLILSLEIPLLLRVMTPPEFWVGGGIVSLAVVSRILNAAYQQVSFGLIYAKKTFNISVIQGVTATLSIAFNFLLIPRYGILGAVLASCLVALCQCVMAHYMSVGYYPIPFQWGKIAQMTLAAATIYILVGPVSVDSFGLAPWLNQTLKPSVASMMTAMHLDAIKDGKLLLYVTDNIPLVVEGTIKLFLAFSFLPILIFMGIVPRRLFRWQVLCHPLRAFAGG